MLPPPHRCHHRAIKQKSLRIIGGGSAPWRSAWRSVISVTRGEKAGKKNANNTSHASHVPQIIIRFFFSPVSPPAIADCVVLVISSVGE